MQLDKCTHTTKKAIFQYIDDSNMMVIGRKNPFFPPCSLPKDTTSSHTYKAKNYIVNRCGLEFKFRVEDVLIAQLQRQENILELRRLINSHQNVN